ncbi:MipA/OmpV family protein, partial [Rubrivivax gelatinosus]|uniref:MipA/OmpV family protein n=1 Tax=Rubrivivax gelatinosus TaxID=28068 RepID=UPI0005C17089
VVPAAAEPLWELGAGATVLRLPHYRGAADSSTWVLPLPWFVYRGEVLRADRDGARARLFETERTRSDDDDARRGMDDLEPTVEVGPRLRVALAKGADWKTELRLPLRAVIGVDRSPSLLGWTAAPALAVDGEHAGFGW